MWDLEYHTIKIGGVEVERMSGRQAAGKPVLQFHIRLRLKALQWTGQPPIGQIVCMGGEVETSVGQIGLRPHLEHVGLFEHECNVILESEIDERQLRLLDESRSRDGSITFVMHFRALVDGCSGVLPVYARCQRVLNQSEWLEVLRYANAEDRFAIEALIRRPRQSKELASAADEFRKARDLLEKRETEPMLTACRRAFEHMPPPNEVDGLDRDWNITQRVDHAHAAVRHIMHAGAHTGIGDPDPREARLAIALTAALLDYHNRES